MKIRACRGWSRGSEHHEEVEPVPSVRDVRGRRHRAAREVHGLCNQTTLRINGSMQIHAILSLEAQHPDSGRKILGKWHGTGACHGVFIPETRY